MQESRKTTLEAYVPRGIRALDVRQVFCEVRSRFTPVPSYPPLH